MKNIYVWILSVALMTGTILAGKLPNKNTLHAFSPNKKTIVYAENSWSLWRGTHITVWLVDVATNKKIAQQKIGFWAVSFVGFSSDGSQVLLDARDLKGTINFKLNAKTLKEFHASRGSH